MFKCLCNVCGEKISQSTTSIGSICNKCIGQASEPAPFVPDSNVAILKDLEQRRNAITSEKRNLDMKHTINCACYEVKLSHLLDEGDFIDRMITKVKEAAG